MFVSQGVSTHIKLKAAGELQDSGKREVYFEANGVPRVVEVVDKKSTEVLGKAAIREKVRLPCNLHSHRCSPRVHATLLMPQLLALLRSPARTCTCNVRFMNWACCLSMCAWSFRSCADVVQCGAAVWAVLLQADVGILGSVGAPMAGSVIEVSVKAGQAVHAGQQLAVLSAMKMETAVCAPIAGVVTQVAVVKNDPLDAGDLIVFIDATSPAAPPLITIDSDPMAIGSSSDTEAAPQNGSNGSAAAAAAAPSTPQPAQAQR